MANFLLSNFGKIRIISKHAKTSENAHLKDFHMTFLTSNVCFMKVQLPACVFLKDILETKDDRICV